MDILERLKLRTGEPNEEVLLDCMESARNAIMARRFPYGEYPDEVEPRYMDLYFRISMDLYNKIGAEGETSHSENGVSRGYGAAWVSDELLGEVVPFVGVV